MSQHESQLEWLPKITVYNYKRLLIIYELAWESIKVAKIPGNQSSS